MHSKAIYMFLIPIILFLVLSYFWFDSARNYVHGSVANELIEVKLSELKLIDKAIEQLESGETEAALKSIYFLREFHKEDLSNIQKNLEPEKSWVDIFTLSPETMENLRQFFKSERETGQ
ncbi:MAG: hypothetical protein MK096_06355 [Oleiphilaceae bacterium]|nr:hypothetical protein [Oleiphilaceae bacterium]